MSTSILTPRPIRQFTRTDQRRSLIEHRVGKSNVDRHSLERFQLKFTALSSRQVEQWHFELYPMAKQTHEVRRKAQRR
jgi:hypothetical protein